MEKKVILDQATGAIKSRIIVNNNKPDNLIIALSDVQSKIKFTGNASSFEKSTGSHSIAPGNYQIELIGNGRAEIRLFSVNVYWYSKGGTQPQLEKFDITSNRETIIFWGKEGALRLTVKSDTSSREFIDGETGEFEKGSYKAQIDSISEGDNPYFIIANQ